MRYSLLLVFFIPVLLQAEPSEEDTGQIVFSARPYKIKYEVGRELESVPFVLKNNTDARITAKLVGAWLVRGESVEPLAGSKIKLYYKNDYRELVQIELAPGTFREFNIIFEPFEIFYGSQYRIKVLLEVNDQRYEATCDVKMYKQNRIDPNRHRKN